MKKTKICLITPMIYPVPAVKGGAVEGLIELLVRQNEISRQLELTVVSAYDEDAVSKAKAYKNSNFVFVKRGSCWDKIWSSKPFLYINKISMRLTGNTMLSMPFVKCAWRYIADQDFDRYILEGGGDCYNFGYLHKKISPEKLWVHFHGEVVGDRAIKTWFSRCLVVSNYIGRKLICNGIVDSRNVVVLPNCFDSKSMASDKTEVCRKNIRQKYGMSQDDFIFVYWGRLIPEKGVLEAVKAFSLVAEKDPNARLLIIGNATFGYETKSSYDESLVAACNVPQLRDKVRFTGFVSHDDMGSLLDACDVGLIPSLWDDPAPLTVFEGLSKGLPLIASAVGGIPEIIIDDYNGILIEWSSTYVDDLAGAMHRMYMSEDFRKKLAKNGLKTAERYTDEIYYNKFVKIVKGCV